VTPAVEKLAAYFGSHLGQESVKNIGATR